MILPTLKTLHRLGWALGAAGVALVLPPALSTLLLALPVVVLVHGALCGLELFQGRARAVTVELGDELPVGREAELRLLIERSKSTGLSLDLAVISKGPIALEETETVRVQGRTVEVSTSLMTLSRGPVRIEEVLLRWISRDGGWARVERFKPDLHARVVLDRESIRKNLSVSLGGRRWSSGLRLERYAGDGTEFRALREWTPGLDPRGIDWAATARVRQLIWREHRAERDQTVVLVLDTGRRMGERHGRLDALDHAIQVGLGFALVALRTGDRVGLLAHDAEERAWLEPRGGIGHYRALERAASEVVVEGEETNLSRTCATLLDRLPRRALVVLLTESANAQALDIAGDLLGRLATRHLVVHLTFPENQLTTISDEPASSLEDLHARALAHRFLAEREEALTRLARTGVKTIERDPNRALAPLLRHYNRVKREERIA